MECQQRNRGHNLEELNKWMGVPPSPFSTWALKRARHELEDAGLEIERAEEAFPVTRFLDVEAIVHLLKAVSWQIPDFSVAWYFAGYFDKLRAIHLEIQSRGSIEVPAHRFLLIGHKPE